ncbi:MAG: SUMF1/EgtB/PvdO family nonheme iron enzyme [Chitinophagaceae bacterium]
MKLKSLFTALFCLFSGMATYANNIQVSNVSLTGWNSASDYTMVKFNLSWENSWRTSSAPSNWDAAWVFVKYRVNGGDWNHAVLNNNGHQAATGSSVDVGLVNPSASFNASTNPGAGAFVYRSADGVGNVSYNDIELRWNYGQNGVNDNDVVDVQVYAIEMVYVPSGAFYLGTGGSIEFGSFTNGSLTLPVAAGGATNLSGAASVGKIVTLSGGGNTTGLSSGQIVAKFNGTGTLGGANGYDTVDVVISSTQFSLKNTPSPALSGASLQVTGPTIPYEVTSEAALTIDNAPGALWGTSSNNSSTIGNSPSNAAFTLPASFPKGFASFYCMKYEISQSQWVDFLNSLNRSQQTSRVATNITGTNIINRFVMSNSSSPSNRNGVRCDATIPATGPVTFYNDLNNNGIPNESSDGQNIACGHINTSDLLSYLDWSALRPMTELEFEKACRGTQSPVNHEYAWGTASATAYTGFSNSGSANEQVTPSNANVVINALSSNSPARVGNFARAGNTRAQSGATFYGILDMTGNVVERCISVAGSQGRAFTGLHGNGSLNATTGLYDVSNWPSGASPQTSFRGGSFQESAIPRGMVSDRSLGLFTNNTRAANNGGRGVRSAQ